MATNVTVSFELINNARTVDFSAMTGISYVYPDTSGVPAESADFIISATDFTVDNVPSASSLDQSSGCHWELTVHLHPFWLKNKDGCYNKWGQH